MRVVCFERTKRETEKREEGLVASPRCPEVSRAARASARTRTRRRRTRPTKEVLHGRERGCRHSRRFVTTYRRERRGQLQKSRADAHACFLFLVFFAGSVFLSLARSLALCLEQRAAGFEEEFEMPRRKSLLHLQRSAKRDFTGERKTKGED